MLRMRQGIIVAVGIAVAAAMVVLGIWQLDVYRAQGQRAALERATAPAVPLADVAPAGAAIGDAFGYSVWFTGSYDPRVQLLLPIEGQPGRFRVVTAFRETDGTVVPVIRGISGAQAPAPPTGEATQTGILLPSEDNVPDPYGLRLPTLAQSWPAPLIGGSVTLSADLAKAQGLEPAQPNLPAASGRLRNGAYAMQWWVFALFALVLTSQMVRDLGRHRVLGAGVLGAGALDDVEPETEPAQPAEET